MLKTKVVALVTPLVSFGLALPVEGTFAGGHSTDIRLWFLDLVDFHLLSGLCEALDAFTQTLMRCFVHHRKALVHLMPRGYYHWLAGCNS